MLKQKTVIFVVAALAGTLHAQAETTPVKVALIDTARVMQSASDGKKAKDALKKQFDDTQKRLMGENEKVQKAMQDLEKQSAVLDQSVMASKREEIQQQVMNEWNELITTVESLLVKGTGA